MIIQKHHYKFNWTRGQWDYLGTRIKRNGFYPPLFPAREYAMGQRKCFYCGHEHGNMPCPQMRPWAGIPQFIMGAH